jgi:hypothetical protein
MFHTRLDIVSLTSATCNVTLSPFYRAIVDKLVQTCVETGYIEFCCGFVNKIYNNVYALCWSSMRAAISCFNLKVGQTDCAFRLILIILTVLIKLFQNEYHHRLQDFLDSNEFTNLNVYPNHYFQRNIKHLVNNTSLLPGRNINGNLTIKIQLLHSVAL